MTPITPIEAQRWQLVFDAIQNDAALLAQSLDFWRTISNPLLLSICLAVLISLLFSTMLAAAYRPRIPRGGFWLPAFGLLGGAPTLYYHTRPSSLLGMRHKKHRHRHHSHSQPAV